MVQDGDGLEGVDHDGLHDELGVGLEVENVVVDEDGAAHVGEGQGED